jgi:hypothetical protein
LPAPIVSKRPLPGSGSTASDGTATSANPDEGCAGSRRSTTGSARIERLTTV